jgi:hypothetical protein
MIALGYSRRREGGMQVHRKGTKRRIKALEEFAEFLKAL